MPLPCLSFPEELRVGSTAKALAWELADRAVPASLAGVSATIEMQDCDTGLDVFGGTPRAGTVVDPGWIGYQPQSGDVAAPGRFQLRLTLVFPDDRSWIGPWTLLTIVP